MSNCPTPTPSSASTTIPQEDQKPIARKDWIKYIIGDPYTADDPQLLSAARKRVIIFVIALSGISGPMASMIYMPGLLSVARDLNTSMEAVNGTVSAYVVFMGIAPLIWASLSDVYGRKRMFLLTLALGIIASIICANSTNIAMLIIFRAIQAAGQSSSQTLGAGVIADTIPIAQRGKAYGFFYTGPLVGPVIGPTVGGFLCQYLGWRSTFYFLAILGGVLLILVAAFLPETLRKQKSTKADIEDDNDNKHTAKVIAQVFAPMITLLRDPSVLVITVYCSIIYASLYFLNPTITYTFQTLYGYNEWQVGLCYLAFGVGLMLGSILAGQFSDWVLQYLKNKNNRQIVPEMRLRAAIPSFILIPAGYLIYGWTTEKGVGVYAPIIGLFVYALGQMTAFTPANVYLVDSQPGHSATAVGVNNCSRSIVAAIMTIFSTTALDALGPGILFSILAAVNVLNVGTVIVCMLFGEHWRRNYAAKLVMRKNHSYSNQLQHSKEKGSGGDNCEQKAGAPCSFSAIPSHMENHYDPDEIPELALARMGSRHSTI